jgi:hypothetical protein
MSVITREILNPNLSIESSITHADGSIQNVIKSYNEITFDIDCAKTYLINERNAQAGQKVLLCENAWPHFLIWFIACSELGMGFVFLDQININNSESLVNKLNGYGKIDHVIVWPYGTLAKNLGPYNVDPIHVGVYSFYRSPLTRPDEHTDVFLATPESKLFYRMTDGIPKIIEHSHQYVYDLLERNAKLYNLKDNDSCLHTTGFHLNFSPASYILPVIKYCATHYFVVDIGNNVKNILQLKNITHNMQNGFDNQPIFETLETLGPVLLNNKCLDNFFGVYLGPGNFLTIRLPDTTDVITNSVFSKENDEFILVDTPNVVIINGTPINTSVLVSVVASFLKATPGLDFNLFVDSDRIYITATTSLNLTLLNSYIVTSLLLTEYIINQQASSANPYWLKIS